MFFSKLSLEMDVETVEKKIKPIKWQVTFIIQSECGDEW